MASIEPQTGTSNGLGYAGNERTTTVKQGKQEGEIEVRIEFGGGLHLLFSSTPKHTAYVPQTIPGSNPAKPVDMRYLIKYLKTDLLSEREEMFGDGDGVRPGILVLINDADWELEGELEYELKEKDEVVFISTLHGG